MKKTVTLWCIIYCIWWVSTFSEEQNGPLSIHEENHKALFLAPLCSLNSAEAPFPAVFHILLLHIIGCCSLTPLVHPLPSQIPGILQVAWKGSLWLGLPPWVVNVTINTIRGTMCLDTSQNEYVKHKCILTAVIVDSCACIMVQRSIVYV